VFYVTGLIQREGRTVINAEQCFKLREKAGGGGKGREAVAGTDMFTGLLRSLGKWHLGYQYSMRRWKRVVFGRTHLVYWD